ncbi:imidazole glycerol phosphate synthase subunit HisH [Lacibacter luteus]|uniref:Imidazole glycerol phosphate synthase subunit HisH n=1 Tax=Lacibacter luteus TaxID=2508719 RepID=A0A4Q1CLL1_9BACT|nr:imidazole glycerol phosphate synthase subunit HisH [Lacibacter luteus]RXK61907.1 imidazole glycerol phosphate synthase subunit HisH [Lacibacter luteus]
MSTVENSGVFSVPPSGGGGGSVAIVKYNAGNIQSVLFALERLGVDAKVTDDFEELQKADKVIFPGVGAARSAMDSLKEKGLDAVIKELKQPVLGICVGMQLLFDHSEESDTECLGIIPAKVKLFRSEEISPDIPIKVPQVGWNDIYNLKTDLFSNVPEHSYVYYVHSYCAEMNPYCIATTKYGLEYAGAVQKDNFYGVQFHTEKSAKVGEQILANFLEL